MCSYLAAVANQVNHSSHSTALHILETTINAAVNNATETLSPIFASNPKFSKDLFLKIEGFKNSIVYDLKNTTLNVINSNLDKESMPKQLFILWRKLLMENLAKFAWAVDFTNFQNLRNQKEYMILNLKIESLKLKGLLRARMHQFLRKSFSKTLYKRSLHQNVLKGIAIIITGVITILGSWIILALYAISFLIGAIVRRLSRSQKELRFNA
jgi:hypothetical protein